MFCTQWKDNLSGQYRPSHVIDVLAALKVSPESLNGLETRHSLDLALCSCVHWFMYKVQAFPSPFRTPSNRHSALQSIEVQPVLQGHHAWDK